MNTPAHDLKALFDAAQEARKPELRKISGQGDEPETEVLLVPDGMSVLSVKKYLDEYRHRPERRKGTATVRDLPSFIELTNRFKDEHSALFAIPDPAKPSITAVLNYSEAGDETTDARFGDHRVHYPCPLSEEWKAWHGNDDKPMSQRDFGYFLEERILDIGAPVTAEPIEGEPASDAALRHQMKLLGGACADAAKLMELSKGFKVIVNDTVHEARNLSTGEAQLQYVSEHRDGAGQPITVPSLFLIQIPVFELGALWRIPVRLRYRIKDGKPFWFYELLRADKVFDVAFREAAAEAAAGAGLPIYFGEPERQAA